MNDFPVSLAPDSALIFLSLYRASAWKAALVRSISIMLKDLPREEFGLYCHCVTLIGKVGRKPFIGLNCFPLSPFKGWL